MASTAPEEQDRVPLDLISTATREVDGLPAVARVEEVERLIGASGGQPSHPRVKRQVCQAVERASELVHPRCAYRVLPVAEAGARERVVTGNTALCSRKLAGALRESTRVVVFSVTVGTPIEAEIRRLSEAGKHFDAHVLDAAASAAVESLADAFQADIQARVRSHGLGTTLRFSPGYCDWKVNGQQSVFRLLGPRPAGIELLPSCLMTPRKSITGAFGLPPLESSSLAGRDAGNPCTSCDMRKRCRVRRY